MIVMFGKLRSKHDRAVLLIAFWILLALLGPLCSSHDPGAIGMQPVFSGPSMAHLLGTDYLGRDTLARLLNGIRHTVLLCFASTLFSCSVGTFLGIAAVTSRVWVEAVTGRLADGFLSIPSLLFALLVIAVFGTSTGALIMTMGIIYTPGAYRTSRALAQRIARLDFVTVARARGESTPYIILQEILPNMAGPMIADVGLRFIYSVLLLSNLSFLGIGVQPPEVDLGSMVRENMLGMAYGSPAMIVPVIVIAVLTVGINLALDSSSGKR
ncbi:ABC transporter oligopeptide permease [Gluconobacter thailandicus F149-1 = NBRC 100600]|uniref:ABC transporter permease n=2 Tax=Gluconobacter thailandicus TaxID=257438 RepID=A0ABQ0IZF4_GLUTH|nr:DNA-directed RNA polymerase subunit alpha [Gluconobacter thailandicus]GAC88416.1 ABC transporter permease [Gluconobacter thailandicus NBRC 3255]GAD27594.1 ABC transporter permease [Gluconobacter thailandicus NBRC 3257]GAN91940.1 ABC transporter oligopeptide permease [Gluconobacter thailandicus F149-1 = NBRC 100600]GBR61639.1 dipeptide/oligopeptide/nickel ABC transporter permease [Gluconobacter thailandicus F149-1 = NBRC 100600]